MSQVIVIGSGVIGLSSARCLQLAGYDVRIVTRELPLATTSVAAGAVWSGSDLDGRSRDWARATLEQFLSLTEEAESGVTLQRMREVYAEAVPDPWYRELLPFFQRLSKHEMRGGLIGGYLMDVPMVAPPIYLKRLHDQFLAAGGRLEQRKVDSLEELAGEASLLVNCTGVGARELAKDDSVYPLRGQTMLTDAQGIRVGYMDNNAVNHIFPRADGVLIGGVKVKGDWNRQLDPAISADIMRRCSRIEKRLAGAKVLQEFVGLRPGRDEARLEVEQLANGGKVIHNYGHAAVGYTLSWGCALEVAALARQTEVKPEWSQD
ncbi:MAG: FAD-dependent oxidoreductase [Chloroflexota bacterium]|nr:FAD-dependent oxidoreductase [Chloroflexota bacterium]